MQAYISLSGTSGRRNYSKKKVTRCSEPPRPLLVLGFSKNPTAKPRKRFVTAFKITLKYIPDLGIIILGLNFKLNPAISNAS